MNKYLEQVEKQASLLGGAVLTHLAQNISTGAALKSKRVATGLANYVRQGYQGVHDVSLREKAKDALKGAFMPDLAVAKGEAHALGRAIKAQAPSLSKRQQVGLRMLSQGRFKDMVRYGLHRDPEIKRVAHMATSKLGILGGGSSAVSHLETLEAKTPTSLRGHLDKVKNMALSDIPKAVSDAKDKLHTEATDRLSKLWKDKDLPLLRNISANITRPSKKLGHKLVPGKPGMGHAIAGGVAAGIAEPVAGMFDLTKTVASSEFARKNKYIKKVSDIVADHLIKQPAEAGLKGGKMSMWKNRVYGTLVNPMSAQIQRTTNRIANAVHKSPLD